MMHIDERLTPASLAPQLDHFWLLSGEKIRLIQREYDESKGSPVFTRMGKYSSRGWTEWTQGFQFGSALLQFDATGEQEMLSHGREKTLARMAPHLTHTGVHDHGFNNISTYGNLLRLMQEGKIPFQEWEKNFYELALKVSGAIQATRWTTTREGGFIHSFNGAHSLFVDTLRSCRSLMVSHLLGHSLSTEGDVVVNLMERAIQHITTTARHSIYYGEGRDRYDQRGRTAHEAIFNVKDGNFRCPNSQQGYSGFTTWTRGLAWAMTGFAEELECFRQLDEAELLPFGGWVSLSESMLKAARAVCDFYIANTPTDGIPYWDTGAPLLHRMGDYLNKPSDPFNGFEPVDSSAAAIGAQGLLRLGHYLIRHDDPEGGHRYWQAGLTVLHNLLQEPYLSLRKEHQGLLLHSVYHQPNGWDYLPEGSPIPYGESSMWGDYHLREAALYLQKMNRNERYLTFFNCTR
ncbi:MAG: hypothetical protein LWW85_01475 [Marinilabiliales bacterium]|nr:hypothetical protein [Marinilabiliales bacterium]